MRDLNPVQRRLLGKSLPLQERIIAAVEISNVPKPGRRSDKIAGCCEMPLLGIRDDGSPAVRLCRCRDRLCQICTRYRSMQVGSRLSTIVQAMNAPKFLTLTLRDDGCSLTHRLDRLIDSFRELRRRVDWKRNVSGGVATIEITRGKEGGHWHVHLHALIDSRFFPQASLSDMWHQITGDSMIVDIRPVHEVDKAVRYITKYAAKPGNFWGWDLDEIAECAEALHRRRCVITFGTSHNIRIDTDDDVPGVDDTAGWLGVSTVKRAAFNGCGAAARLIDLAGRHGGLVARLFGADVVRGDDVTPREWTPSLSASWREAFAELVQWLDRDERPTPEPNVIVPPDHPRLFEEPPPPPAQLHAWRESP